MKNEYTTEKEFCKANKVGPLVRIPCWNDETEFHSILPFLSKYRAYLIEQGKRGKLSLEECKKIVLTDTKYLNWNGLLRDLDLSPFGLDEFIDRSSQMYAEQFILSDLESENARLKAALEEIVNLDNTWADRIGRMQRIASEALNLNSKEGSNG